MSEIQVYEYYDGYPQLEPEEYRVKIQYIVLGSIDNGKLLTICYAGKFNHIANIGVITHSKSWKKEMIGCDLALKYVRNAVRRGGKSIAEMQQLIEEMMKNKEEIDGMNQVKYGDSCSETNTLYGISIHWGKEESYTDKFVKELGKKVEMMRKVDEFMEKYNNKIN